MMTTPAAANSSKGRNIFFPPPPTTWERFIGLPSAFIAKYIYSIAQSRVAPTSPSLIHPPIRIVCISDTHNTTLTDVPPGDILLHAGDMTNSGSFEELQAQITWLNSLPHTHKIAIGGNHDVLLDEEFVKRVPARVFDSHGATAKNLDWGSVVYLNDTSVTLDIHGREINVFGCPLTPKLGNWGFQYLRKSDVWTGRVPEGTDILLTHGPPKGHLDLSWWGCGFLNRELERVQPQLCVFGHIHKGRGKEQVCWDLTQQLYDRVVTGETGWLGVLRLAVEVAKVTVWGKGFGGREQKGTLINAAMARGGRRERWREKLLSNK
ncbi:Metallo-dependent phosphatase [Lindgomyces ingoldianus]|uniref:Metallo-dependent phosphatase n=1 Tax=Lindgomyces ingoldianus TaxID=673940 RepID=A0ACB6QQA9_9PLEO|nr:Metallo-dependent phosphatase [Lindgomyces ingoldianus]KAF2468351.1 Metallo-dependent phosphatase [Lindgomyces ingoldianus]